MYVEFFNFIFLFIILEYSLRISILFICLIFYFVFEYREYIKNKKIFIYLFLVFFLM